MAIIIDDILYDRVSLPPNSEHFLERPHVAALLQNAIQKPLITVTASAGYGKTQAVSMLLNSPCANVIWFQLSELDNLIVRFWARFVFGFKSYTPELAKNLQKLGYPETLVAFDQLLHLLAEELARYEKRFVIVLDDFHLIREKTVLGFIEKLINAHLKRLSIVMISRTQPDLNLIGFLSKGLLARITEDDLRFSPDEMKAYYARQGLMLDDTQLSGIYASTEGWIFAIYLVGLTMKKSNVKALNPVSMAKIDIFESIEKEIFTRASQKLRDFLVAISLLHVLPRGLMMKLSEHDDTLLREMTQISLFVRYDPSTDGYRMHHLLREFLLEKAQALSKERTDAIYLAAAQWYEENDSKPEAVDHYKKCGLYDKIFDIIMKAARRVPQKVAESLVELVDQAPEELLRARPIMHVLKGYYLLNNNKIDTVSREMTHLYERYSELPATEENRAILGEVCILLGLVSIINQTLEFEAFFAQADTCLPRGSSMVDNQYNIAEGINICGIKNPQEGELERYRDAMFRAMPVASKVMNGCAYGAEFLNAADSCYMTGDVRGAEQNAYEALYRAERKAQYGIECMANFILLRVYFLKGDYPRVTGILKRMKERVNDLQIPDVIALSDIIEGWFHLKIGEISKIAPWIKHEEETRKMLPPLIVGREYLVRTDAMLVEERNEELLAFMRQTDAVYAERGILYAMIQNEITRAIAYHYMGRPDDSIDALNKAYALSSPNGLIIQYIEYGSRMRTVLTAARRNKRCTIPGEWLGVVQAKSSTYAKQLARVASEYKDAHSAEHEIRGASLSRRELEILDGLCKGLTRNEIAQTCNVSINTVKSMLQSAFTKLGATNSAEAVRLATAMGLSVPPRHDKNSPEA